MRKKIQEKAKDGTLVKSSNGDSAAPEPRKRGRWDQTIDDQFIPAKKAASTTPTWNDVEVRRRIQYFFYHPVFILLNHISLSLSRKRLPMAKEVKHPVQHHEQLECGMQRQAIMCHLHHRLKRLHMRNQRVEIVGMRPQELNVKHLATILDG